MSRQKYTHIQVKEKEILALREAGADPARDRESIGIKQGNKSRIGSTDITANRPNWKQEFFPNQKDVGEKLLNLEILEI